MTVLTDEEISRICLEWPGNATQAARAIEQAVIQKLSKGWVMPEPVIIGVAGFGDDGIGFTTDQLREAFAAGAASQLSSHPEAIAHSYDGYGWMYIDNGSGSSWYEIGMKFPDATPLFTKVQP